MPGLPGYEFREERVAVMVKVSVQETLLIAATESLGSLNKTDSFLVLKGKLRKCPSQR